jgi:hypothetical protein
MERNFSGYMIENSIYLITDKEPNATERKAALTVPERGFPYTRIRIPLLYAVTDS